MTANSGNWFRRAAIVAACILPLFATPASAERVKDLASMQGVRGNQLIGYGIVVGLDNTGDQTTQTPFTTQATKPSMSSKLTSVSWLQSAFSQRQLGYAAS